MWLCKFSTKLTQTLIYFTVENIIQGTSYGIDHRYSILYFDFVFVIPFVETQGLNVFTIITLHVRSK